MKDKANLIGILLILLLVGGCKKDVTNDYLQEIKPQLVVQCTFSSNSPWEVSIHLSKKLNDKTPPKTLDLKEVKIVDQDGIETPLTYNSDLQKYLSKATPKDENSYRLEITTLDNKVIEAEDFAPKAFVFKSFETSLESRVLLGANTIGDRYFKTSFLLEKDWEENCYVKIQVERTSSFPETVVITTDAIERLKAMGASSLFVSFIQSHASLEMPFTEIKEWFEQNPNNYGNVPTETLNLWKEKYDGTIKPYIYSLHEAIKVVYKQSEITQVAVNANDYYYSKNSSFNEILVGNYKDYNEKELSIYTPEQKNTSLQKEEVMKMKEDVIYEYKAHIIRMSEHSNRYIRDLTIQQNSNGSFSPIIPIQSNIKNGTGIFGGINSTTKTLYYSNTIEQENEEKE
ncbi:DUF4249 domain-containing protein [Halosquirtibacter laminarini]|uniref:DUF4249 domain-containing protein n=1 Tax=Halosquirtibacter laminarini TaxID=3374600 RepID=A0AC61NHS6_9BACT|nr:DUF4249 domain-containing protein [Prolixibacteraceae bacterium]